MQAGTKSGPFKRSEATSWLWSTLGEASSCWISQPIFEHFLPGGSHYDDENHHQKLLRRRIVELLLYSNHLEGEKILFSRSAPGMLLKKYFGEKVDAQERRIMSWFSHFSCHGITSFTHGAYALAKYALKHRSTCWHLLEWTGAHSHAPIYISNNTARFAELDVFQTVKNLLKHDDGFWSSREMMGSIEGSDFLLLDVEYWADQFLSRNNSTDGNTLVTSYMHQFLKTSRMKRSEWRHVCSKLLPLLDDSQLLLASKYILVHHAPSGSKVSSNPKLMILCSDSSWNTLEDLLILNACCYSYSSLYAALHNAAESSEIQQAVTNVLETTSSQAFWNNVLFPSNNTSGKIVPTHIFCCYCALKRKQEEGAEQLALFLTVNGLPCRVSKKRKHDAECINEDVTAFEPDTVEKFLVLFKDTKRKFTSALELIDECMHVMIQTLAETVMESSQ